jgi:hypothetical protein
MFGKFIVTPLYLGQPQVEEEYEVTASSQREAEELRSGWTTDGNGEPVRLPFLVVEIEAEAEVEIEAEAGS